jgi:hypothetical protein
MNYQIQGLSIHAEVTGLRSRLSYFSITGVERHAPGARLPPNLRTVQDSGL